MNTPETPSGPWGDPQSWRPSSEPAGKPQSIRTAVNLMYAGAVLSGLNIVASFVQRDDLREQIREAEDSLTADEVDTLTNAFLGLGVVIGLVAIGLWLWMASANGQGKSWARIVASVLGGLYILLSLFNLAGGQLTSLGVVVVLVGLVLAVAILVLLYRPDSNRYYDAMTTR